jgi:small-conductance mechanosensitive channel/CRP-like cAMP-binding protein
MDFFWHELRPLILQNQQSELLFAFAILMAVSLWHWRPQDRKPVATALMFFALALCGLIFSHLLTTLQIKTFTKELYAVSMFAAGMASIRLFGLFLFRLILPLCRISLLRILEDLVEFAGYCAWLMLILHKAGLDLSGIVTTSAVMTAVLAISMQDTLGNILGGLALQLDNSIKVGDWIKVDAVTGRIIDIRWRYTAIETRNWETIIIPNSLLMKGEFAVLGRRRDQPLQWVRWVYFEVGYEHSPGYIIDIVQNAIRNGHISNVAQTPPANCFLMDFNPSAFRYAVRYWLCEIEADDATDSQIRLRLYAALQRSGIDLPYPQYHLHLTHKDDRYEQNKQLRTIKEQMEALRHVDLFNSLHDDELVKIAEQLVYTPFAQGEIMMKQGTIAHWLYIIISGEADVFLELAEGKRHKVGTVHGGNLLGEMGLMTGDPRSATVIAQSEVLAYRLNKDSFKKILEERSELAIEISKLLVSRQFSLDNFQEQLDSESLVQLMSQQQNKFLEQIRNFFGLRK